MDKFQELLSIMKVDYFQTNYYDELLKRFEDNDQSINFFEYNELYHFYLTFNLNGTTLADTMYNIYPFQNKRDIATMVLRICPINLRALRILDTSETPYSKFKSLCEAIEGSATGSAEDPYIVNSIVDQLELINFKFPDFIITNQTENNITRIVCIELFNSDSNSVKVYFDNSRFSA